MSDQEARLCQTLQERMCLLRRCGSGTRRGKAWQQERVEAVVQDGEPMVWNRLVGVEDTEDVQPQGVRSKQNRATFRSLACTKKMIPSIWEGVRKWAPLLEWKLVLLVSHNSPFTSYVIWGKWFNLFKHQYHCMKSEDNSSIYPQSWWEAWMR